MVKSPRIRHSKTSKEPVTIELGADEVKRVEPEPAKEATPAGPSGERKEAKPASSAAPKPAAPENPEAQETAKPAETTTKTGPAPERQGATSFGRDAGRQAAGSAPTREKPAEPPRRGTGAALAAGFVGGAVVLAGVWGLDRAGLLGRASEPAPFPIVEDDGRVTALQGELESLRAEIAGLAEAARTPAAGDGDAALREAIAAGQSRMEAMGVLVDEARAELAELRQAANTGESGEDLLAPLQSRIDALEETVSALPLDDGAEQDEALRAGLETLGEEVRQAAQASAAAQEAVSTAVARLDALEERLAALSQSVEEQAERPGVALAIAASALKAAVDRGTPFAAELDTYASVAPDAPEIAGLRAFAASGVPTRTAIEAETDRAAIRMIEAGREHDAQAGLLDRLMSSAQSLVTVRPIGAVEGDGVAAIVARMEAAIRAGDYEAAITEYGTLPPDAQAAGEDFIAHVRARAEADRLTGQALASALRA